MTAAELTALLDELGKRLGPAGERVFELTLRQVLIDAVLALVVAVGLLSFAAVVSVLIVRSYRAAWTRYRKGGSSIYASEPDSFGWMLASAVPLFALALAGQAVYSAIRVLANPEFAVLERLLDAIR